MENGFCRRSVKVRSAVAEKSPWAVGIADAHGVLRLRSAAPRFAQDDSGEVLAEMLAEVLVEVLAEVFDCGVR
jgi:hypothetical protein